MLKPLSRWVFRFRQWRHRQTSAAKIHAYLQSSSSPKLHIGAGPNLLDDWLNTTLQPIKKGSVFLDAIKPYPAPDASFNYVFSEHMIEHVSFAEGQLMLKECFRVLKKGGKIRLATPDLERILGLYKNNPSPEELTYMRWIIERFLSDSDGDNPAFVINNAFRNWKHQFLYDFRTMKFALERLGFVDVQRFRPGQSNDPILQNIEHHGDVIQNEAMNQFESLVIEARKP